MFGIRKSVAAAMLAAGFAAPAAADCTFGLTFGFGSSALTEEARAVLDEINLRFPGAVKRIEGHTDAVGTEPANLALSQARANAVMGYLQSLGETTSTLQLGGVFGETQLLVSTEGPEVRNRRAVIEVVGANCDEFADLGGSTNIAFGALPAALLIPLLLGGGGGGTSTTTTTTTTGG